MTSKLILILVISLFAFCQGDPICTSKNQCRDLWTAIKCKSVDYCIAEDWSKLKPSTENDDVCRICLQMVQEARDVLQSNDTMENLKAVLEGSCKLLTLKPAVELCSKFADEYAVELVKVLASQMDPRTVCTVAKLCNYSAFRLAQMNSKDCTQCRAFMQLAEEQMAGVSYEEFRNNILKVCRHAGGFSDACSHLGLVNAKSLYESTKTVLSGKPCEATLLCPSNSGKANLESLTWDMTCPMCRTVMRALRNQLLKVKSAKQFGEYVEEVCSTLNLNERICRELSSEEFYEKLRSFENLPDMICHVAYCMERNEEDVAMWPLVPADLESYNSTDMSLFDLMAFADLLEKGRVTEEETTTAVPVRPTIAYGDRIENPVFLAPMIPQKYASVGEEERCGLCLNVMNIFKEGDSMLWGPKLEKECRSLEGSSENSCRDLSSTFVSLVSLLKNSTETDACNFMGLCDPNPEAVFMSSGVYCTSCMLTIQSLKDAIKNEKTDGAVESILDSLCDLLPHSEKHLCYNLVKNVGVEGFKELIMKISPSTVCTELHICKRDDDVATTTAVEVTVKKESPENAKECKICMLTMKMLLKQLENNKTEEAIRGYLNSLCSYFPTEVKDSCQNIIDQYADMIIDMIIADFNASEICVYLRLCPHKVLLGEKENGIVYNVETNEIRDWDEYEGHESRNLELRNAFEQFHSNVQDCALCEALVGVISRHKNMLKKGYDFEAHAQAICSIVPQRKFQRCKSLLVSYGPSIVNLILDHNVDRNEICVYIDLCSPAMQAKVNQPVSVPEPEVIETKKDDCFQGPAFWCASVENARKCKTYLHCMETVWKNSQTPPSSNL